MLILTQFLHSRLCGMLDCHSNLTSTNVTCASAFLRLASSLECNSFPLFLCQVHSFGFKETLHRSECRLDFSLALLLSLYFVIWHLVMIGVDFYIPIHLWLRLMKDLSVWINLRSICCYWQFHFVVALKSLFSTSMEFC